MYIEYALHREQPESQKTNFYLMCNNFKLLGGKIQTQFHALFFFKYKINLEIDYIFSMVCSSNNYLVV